MPGRPADFGRTNKNVATTYPDAEFVVIDCTTSHFNPLGWSAIGEKSAKMLEFGTRDADSGAPADVSQRHKFSRQLDARRDAELLAKYKNPAWVLAGWTPSTTF